ncbi:VWD domain-containing protein [Nostoc sp. CHAB 5824]|nr:VWD domain-containing protein [Nostoc sp. CHAB 5824]
MGGNGLDFMRARFYDSSLGRFTAVDPLGISAGDTNLYRYTFNNPLIYTDPSGNLVFLPIVIAAGIGAFTGAATDAAIQGVMIGIGVQEEFDWGSVGVSAGLGAICGGGTAALRNVGSQAGTIFSHALPKRWGRGTLFNQNSAIGRLNGQYVSPMRHYKHDPFYYGGKLRGGQRTGRGAWRNWGDKYGPLRRTIDRIPDFLKNSVIGGILGRGISLLGGTWNDPHLQTLDGLGYDFQSVGEFTLVKSTTDDFEIQTRQQPWFSSTSVSTNTAVAIKIDGQRIAFYANQAQPLLVNGTATNLGDRTLYAVGQNLVTREGDRYNIITANNDLIQISDRGSFLNINLGLADNRQGKVVGLLGNYNDNRNDDFSLRDGTAIGDSISNQQLYGDYAASWRITQATSLFDYAPKQDTNTFTDLTFPQNIVTAATLTPEQRATAEQIARDAGITDPDVLEDVILDIFITNGDSQFVEGAITQQRLETISAPNTLINPDGFGTQNWLTAGAVIPYTIRFSNNADQGTTPIAQVSITQQLDSY